ncbi:MFS transporter [Flavobacterium pectinovorum]|uniref:MFS transporter n=1 Tax=Flavobacterium pectinovorum TaxID=29533 RepID=A0A502EFV5_9FLAO|nr:MFS transporter [Flavobacterium pectinovorum]TPG36327.1 MFS transporter [Flavobacterium pectinovorum]
MTNILNIRTFKAFQSRNYALFFGGQLISRIGMWMQRTAVVWIVYSMTHSTFMLGLTVFAEQFPSFLFSLLGGVVADRNNRYKVLMITQIISALQAVLLTILVFMEHYVIWEILSLSVLLGIVNAFDIPARQPLVHDIINKKEDLPNAIALNSTLNNLARLIGPSLSGIVLTQFGAGNCFLVNAISFIAVIISLMLMKLPPYKPTPTKKKISTDLKEGLLYLKNTPKISVILIMLSLLCLLVVPYNTLLPVYAKVIFKGDAATFGYINSFIGLGAVIAAIYLASLKSSTNLHRILFTNTVILGISLIVFSHLNIFPIAMAIAIICGFGTMSLIPICNTILQLEADEAMRGRVISFFAMAAFGMIPIGSLFIGMVSKYVGAPNSLLIQGIIALLIALSFYLFYKKKKRDRALLIPINTEETDTINNQI